MISKKHYWITIVKYGSVCEIIIFHIKYDGETKFYLQNSCSEKQKANWWINRLTPWNTVLLILRDILWAVKIHFKQQLVEKIMHPLLNIGSTPTILLGYSIVVEISNKN